MDEREFQQFYAQTCRSLRAYLRRASGDQSATDDLLQETYFRFIRASGLPTDADQRRGYLFRIAMNLVADYFRKAGRNREVHSESIEGDTKQIDLGLRTDLEAALEKLKPKDRTLIWLAYVNGSSHREIAAATGVAEASVRPLLLRARRKMAALLRKRGIGLESIPRVGE